MEFKVEDELREVDRISGALRAMAREDQHLGASASVEERLRAEVRAIARARRRRAMLVASAAAVVAIVVRASPARQWLRGPSALPRAGIVETGVVSRRVTEVSTAFLPLSYSGLPLSNAQVVRVAVPRAALASFGLAPLDAPEGGSSATVQADVLVGEDGIARAVRFVRQTGTP